MECKFEVGQKVVCIDDDWTHWMLPSSVEINLPVKGNIYTITEVGPASLVGGVGIRLAESHPVVWYSYLCFAPVQENKGEQRTQKGVDKLKELLTPTKVNCPRKLEDA